MNVLLKSAKVVSAYVAPHVHAGFEIDQGGNRILAHKWRSYEPSEEISGRDVIDENLLTAQSARRVKVQGEIRVIGRTWIL